MNDPKENEIRREVGWVDNQFVELVLTHDQGRYELTALVDGEKREIKETKHAIDALIALDIVEFELFGKIVMQGVAI